MPRDPAAKRLQDALARRNSPLSKLARNVAPFADRDSVEPPLPLSLQRAFTAFGLDPKNPFDWAGLTIELAGVLYGRGKRGRPEGKTKRQRAIETIARAIKGRHPDMTDEQIADVIVNLWRDRFTSENAQENVLRSMYRRSRKRPRDK
jgi:uncharacterized protein (DUF2267 family)